MLHAPHGHVYFSLLLAYRPFPLKFSKVGKNGPMEFPLQETRKNIEISIKQLFVSWCKIMFGSCEDLAHGNCLAAREALCNVRGCIENLLQLRVSISRREISEDTDSTLRGSSE